MPVTKSALKALRRDRRRSEINKPIRSKFKAALKKARENPVTENVRFASSLLDRAAKRKIIHKNKASRLKSKLSRLLRKKLR
ncbi:MAG TPA: 30S ribosomal protein S20 [Candidatus Bathyarchaeia archaeon]|nr:30S ribosomal protein S20 [Candidatus Bathyarchaeia archaeon]